MQFILVTAINYLNDNNHRLITLVDLVFSFSIKESVEQEITDLTVPNTLYIFLSRSLYINAQHWKKYLATT